LPSLKDLKYSLHQKIIRLRQDKEIKSHVHSKSSAVIGQQQSYLRQHKNNSSLHEKYVKDSDFKMGLLFDYASNSCNLICYLP